MILTGWDPNKICSAVISRGAVYYAVWGGFDPWVPQCDLWSPVLFVCLFACLFFVFSKQILNFVFGELYMYCCFGTQYQFYWYIRWCDIQFVGTVKNRDDVLRVKTHRFRIVLERSVRWRRRESSLCINVGKQITIAFIIWPKFNPRASLCSASKVYTVAL